MVSEVAVIKAASNAVGKLVGPALRGAQQQKTRRKTRAILQKSNVWPDASTIFSSSPKAAQTIIHSWLDSPALAELCLQIATELALGSGNTEKALGQIREEFEASLNRLIPAGSRPDADVFATLYGAIELSVSSALAAVDLQKGLSPSARARAVKASAHQAAKRARLVKGNLTLEQMSSYDEFAEALRRQVKSTHNTMRLPHAGTTRRVPYRSLYVQAALRPGPNNAKKVAATVDDLLEENASAGEISEVISWSLRTVLLGDPGGGKSTLSHKLAYDLASDSRSYPPNLVPLLIILRDLVPEAGKLPSLVSHIETICKSEYSVEPPKGAVDFLLGTGRCFILFDGLDELLDTAMRRRVVQSVEAFCARYPTSAALVTSRRIGYEEASLDPEMYLTMQLNDFSEEQVASYASKWFSLDDSLDVPARDELTGSFIADSTYVRDLRTNPLLLSLMCGIYAKERYIPTNRPDVYRKCAELLFERWDKQRGIITPLPFDAHVRLALNALALRMYSAQAQQAGMARAEALRFLTDYLHKKRFPDEVDAENAAVEFLNFCTGRAWVLTDVGADRYAFTHQTFLEYFAAQQLVRLNASGSTLSSTLEDRISAAEWDVVAQLALQILASQVEDSADEFIERLLDNANQLGALSHINRLSFAVRSLEFLVPKPATIQLICTQTASYLQQIDLADFMGGPANAVFDSVTKPLSDLRNCTKENEELVRRYLEEATLARLGPDESSDLSANALLLGGLSEREVLLDSVAADEYSSWRDFYQKLCIQSAPYLKRYSDAIPWFESLAVAVGITSVQEAVSNNGATFLYAHGSPILHDWQPLVVWQFSPGPILGKEDVTSAILSDASTALIELDKPWLQSWVPEFTRLAHYVVEFLGKLPRTRDAPTNEFFRNLLICSLPLFEIEAHLQSLGKTSALTTPEQGRPLRNSLLTARTIGSVVRLRRSFAGRLLLEDAATSPLLEAWCERRLDLVSDKAKMTAAESMNYDVDIFQVFNEPIMLPPTS